jgi:hypothetical protein
MAAGRLAEAFFAPRGHGFHGILTGTATANLVTGLVTISGGHALLDAVNIQAPAHVVR